MSTEQLVSQLTLAAEWDFSQRRGSPTLAAALMLGLAADEDQLAAVIGRVDRRRGLTWPERVGLAAHILLTGDQELPAAA